MSLSPQHRTHSVSNVANAKPGETIGTGPTGYVHTMSTVVAQIERPITGTIPL
jgi:hypothetical protein